MVPLLMVENFGYRKLDTVGRIMISDTVVAVGEVTTGTVEDPGPGHTQGLDQDPVIVVESATVVDRDLKAIHHIEVQEISNPNLDHLVEVTQDQSQNPNLDRGPRVMHLHLMKEVENQEVETANLCDLTCLYFQYCVSINVIFYIFF